MTFCHLLITLPSIMRLFKMIDMASIPSQLVTIIKTAKNLKELVKLLRDTFGDWTKDVKIKETVEPEIKKYLERKEDILISQKEPLSTDDKTTKELIESFKEHINSPKIKQFVDCVDKHWSLPLVKIGLRLLELTEENAQAEIKAIIKNVRYKYGERGVRILYMGSTRVIHLIIDWLYDLKVNKGYNLLDLVRTFEKTLEDWDKITIYVSKEEPQDSIKTKIQKVIRLKPNFFFIFALGYEAVSNAQALVVSLRKTNFFRENCYLDHSSNPIIGELPSYSCYCQYWADR